MRVRCDTSMRRSKEHTSGIDEFGISRWRCKGKCTNCICGIITDKYGNDSHVSFTREGEHYAKIHDTIEAYYKEKQPADSHEQGNRQADDSAEQTVQGI